MSLSRSIRVLVVDDSAFVRKTVQEMLEQDGQFDVVGVARDGREALALVERLHPDVVTLDISMPVMDGLTCLVHLVRRHRQRVVMLSTLTVQNAYPTFKAMALGAIDFVTKPGAGKYLQSVSEVGQELREKVKQAASVPRKKVCAASARTAKSNVDTAASRPTSIEAPVKAPVKGLSSSSIAAPSRIIGFGGSTGGSVAIEAVLRSIPRSAPASYVIVQHLPRGFSSGLAKYLSSVVAVDVQEASDGVAMQRGCAYVAPGGAHVRVQRRRGSVELRVDGKGAPHKGYKPNIDLFFYSLATSERRQAVGVLLSGMGCDGVGGLQAIRKLGGMTIAQDESSAVVPEMPRRAIASGAVAKVAPLGALPAVIMAETRPRRSL